MAKLKRILFQLLSLFRSRKKRMDAPERILFCMCHWLGDTFWASQVIRRFQEEYPDAELFVLTKPFSRELFYGLLPEDHIYSSRSVISDRRRENSSWKALWQEAGFFRKEKMDLVFDLTSNAYSALFAFLTRAYCVGEDSPSNPGSSLYHLPLQIGASQPLYMRPRKLAAKFFQEAPDSTLLPPKPRFSLEDLRKMRPFEGEKLFLLVPGAGWEAKEWQEEKFAAIGKYFMEKGYALLLSGSPKEREKCERIASLLPPGNVHLWIDALAETIAILPHCRFVLCNDSGISHLAGAFGVPVYIFYCMTNPAHLAPPGRNVHIFASSCPLRPREKDAPHHCPLFPATSCSKPCHMDTAPHEVAEKILQDQREL